MTESTNTVATIRVLCVDDHPLVRKGISSILANEPDIHLVGEAGNGKDAIAMFRTHHPDVTLMDLRMPEVDGIEGSQARSVPSFPKPRSSPSPALTATRTSTARSKPACAATCSRKWCILKSCGQSAW